MIAGKKPTSVHAETMEATASPEFDVSGPRGPVTRGAAAGVSCRGAPDVLAGSRGAEAGGGALARMDIPGAMLGVARGGSGVGAAFNGISGAVACGTVSGFWHAGHVIRMPTITVSHRSFCPQCSQTNLKSLI